MTKVKLTHSDVKSKMVEILDDLMEPYNDDMLSQYVSMKVYVCADLPAPRGGKLKPKSEVTVETLKQWVRVFLQNYNVR